MTEFDKKKYTTAANQHFQADRQFRKVALFPGTQAQYEDQYNCKVKILDLEGQDKGIFFTFESPQEFYCRQTSKGIWEAYQKLSTGTQQIPNEGIWLPLLSASEKERLVAEGIEAVIQGMHIFNTYREDYYNHPRFFYGYYGLPVARVK